MGDLFKYASVMIITQDNLVHVDVLSIKSISTYFY